MATCRLLHGCDRTPSAMTGMQKRVQHTREESNTPCATAGCLAYSSALRPCARLRLATVVDTWRAAKSPGSRLDFRHRQDAWQAAGGTANPVPATGAAAVADPWQCLTGRAYRVSLQQAQHAVRVSTSTQHRSSGVQRVYAGACRLCSADIAMPKVADAFSCKAHERLKSAQDRFSAYCSCLPCFRNTCSKDSHSRLHKSVTHVFDAPTTT